MFHHSFFKSFLIQSDQTRHLNITAQRPQLLEFDHHTRWCCRDCNNAVASTSQLGGVDEEDEEDEEAWQLGWQLDGRCDANILGPWHVRDTKTWSPRRSTNMHEKKDVKWKTQAAHAGNSLLMSSSNPRPSKKIAAKSRKIQKDCLELLYLKQSSLRSLRLVKHPQTRPL